MSTRSIKSYFTATSSVCNQMPALVPSPDLESDPSLSSSSSSLLSAAAAHINELRECSLRRQREEEEAFRRRIKTAATGGEDNLRGFFGKRLKGSGDTNDYTGGPDKQDPGGSDKQIPSPPAVSVPPPAAINVPPPAAYAAALTRSLPPLLATRSHPAPPPSPTTDTPLLPGCESRNTPALYLSDVTPRGLLELWLLHCPPPNDVTRIIHDVAPSHRDHICGNQLAVRDLAGWLGAHVNRRAELAERMKRKRSFPSRRLSRRGVDEGDESDAAEGAVMAVVCGPSGSGKSSAVYAVAAEMQVRVIEMSAGVCRSSSAVRGLLQEATLSSGVSDMALILLDEADIVFDEDAGMHSAVADLAKNSKTPIVLTCERPIMGRFGSSLTVLEVIMERPDRAETHKGLASSLKRASRDDDDDDALVPLAELAAGDVRRCLAAVALCRPSADSAAFSRWLANKRVDFAYMDSMSACDEGREPSRETSDRAAQSPLIFDCLPRSLSLAERAVVAVCGAHFSAGPVEIFLGSVLCSVAVISDSLIYVLVDGVENTGLKTGLHQLRLRVGAQSCADIELILIEGIDEADAPPTEQSMEETEDDLRSEDGDASALRKRPASVQQQQAKRGRNSLRVDDEPESDLTAAVPLTSSESHISTESIMSEIKRRGLLPSLANKCDWDSSLVSFSVQMKQSIEDVVKLNPADIESVLDAFKVELLVENAVQSNYKGNSVWTCLNSLSMVPVKPYRQSVESDIDRIDGFSRMLELWSDADYIQRYAYLVEAGFSHSGDNDATCSLRNIADEVRLRTPRVGNETHIFRRELAIVTNSNVSMEKDWAEDSDEEFNNSQESGMKEDNNYCSSFNSFTRTLLTRSDICNFFDSHFKDTVLTMREPRRPRRHVKLEFILETVPWLSKLLTLEENVTTLSNHGLTRRSSQKRNRYAYIRERLQLPDKYLEQLKRFGKM